MRGLIKIRCLKDKNRTTKSFSDSDWVAPKSTILESESVIESIGALTNISFFMI